MVIERVKKDSLTVLVEAVKRFGPRNYSLLSRVTGIPTETVRYKIDHQLVRTGVRVHVSVDYHKLAMLRTWGTFEFEEDNQIISKGVLETLAKIGYLTYYGPVLPHQMFVVVHSIPTKFYEQYWKLLEGLVDVGILNSFEMSSLDVVRHMSMKPEFYDFKRKRWKIPWDELDPRDVTVPHVSSEPRTEPLADKVDLFILKELQLDCTRSLAAIARKLGINYKTLRYHYLEHVAQRNLIDKYLVRWQGTVTKDVRNQLMVLALTIRGLGQVERNEVERVFHSLPFTLLDAFSSEDNLYMAQVIMPSNQYADTLDYVRMHTSGYKGRMNVYIIDPTAPAFTLPYELFDIEKGWIFDYHETLQVVEKVVMAVREEIEKI